MITIRTGDLIYIPQDVDMWTLKNEGSRVSYYKTNKPTTGVFLKMVKKNQFHLSAYIQWSKYVSKIN